MIDCKYQTPENVAKYMVSLLPSTTKTVLEPTKGLGNIVKVLENYDVTAPEDYFLLNKHKKFDAVVANPPFSGKSLNTENAPKEYLGLGMTAGYKILMECMDKTNVVIALMPWYTISDSDVRMRKLVRYGLKSITVLPRKTFNYTRIQTCILELVKGFKNTTEFKSFEFTRFGSQKLHNYD